MEISGDQWGASEISRDQVRSRLRPRVEEGDGDEAHVHRPVEQAQQPQQPQQQHEADEARVAEGVGHIDDHYDDARGDGDAGVEDVLERARVLGPAEGLRERRLNQKKSEAIRSNIGPAESLRERGAARAGVPRLYGGGVADGRQAGAQAAAQGACARGGAWRRVARRGASWPS